MSDPPQSPSALSSSSCDCSAEHEAFIASLDLNAIQSLALKTRRSQLATSAADPDSPAASDLTCTVRPLKQGASNVLHSLLFSDNTHWVIRIPLASRSWSPRAVRQMHHDIVAQRYIAARTAVPVPRIHAFACTADPEAGENPLGHPYMICDYVQGTRLVDVWNEPGWWTDGRTRERTLESLARHMVDLARLEFDSIGCLDDPPAGAPPDTPPRIVAFPSLLGDASEPEIAEAGARAVEEDLGPFTSTHAYLSALLAAVRARTRGRAPAQSQPPHDGRPPRAKPSDDDPTLAFLALLISALPPRSYDTAPFTLCHPDFDSQNVFISPSSGEVTALVDWDGVAAAPRQLGALTLPMWLTVDWDPFAYAGYQAAQAHCDSEAELHRLRGVYADAVERAAAEVLGGDGGRAWGEVTRTSHVVSTLEIGITAEMPRLEIVYRLGKYVFGSGRLVFELLEGIEHCAWYNRKEGEVPEVVEWDWYKEREKERKEGSSTSGSDDEEHSDHASSSCNGAAGDALDPS
ncbi:hypothetical protein GY45DRAFT_992580 [Cubamyces sp. BRFM 1775]|nr:hypothetical protein GY45DRAFT_992580 [Cubamyces sp. BRFM 1775]